WQGWQACFFPAQVGVRHRRRATSCFPHQAVRRLAACAGHLTIHSSRRHFVARLNSSVRPLKSMNLKPPTYYLSRSIIGMLAAILIWIIAFWPLGRPLSTWQYVGAGVFTLVWFYCAANAVQLLRSLFQLWRHPKAPKA